MSSMEDNDSLKKQIKELEKNNKYCPSSDLKSKEDISPSIILNKDNLMIKDLKASVEELNAKLLKVAHNNDALHQDNKSLFKKINLLKDEVKEQKCRASKAEFEVESLRKCKVDFSQPLQTLKCYNDNNNSNNNSYIRQYQGFGTPNVRKLILSALSKKATSLLFQIRQHNNIVH